MASIEDLKRNAEEQEQVNIGGPVKGRHTVILPKTPTQNPVKASDRDVIDLTAMMNGHDEATDEAIKESIAKEILDTENPNSLMSKYIEDKKKEIAEYNAVLDQQQQMLEESEEAEIEALGGEEGTILNGDEESTGSLGFESSYTVDSVQFIAAESNIKVEQEDIEETINTNPPQYDKYVTRAEGPEEEEEVVTSGYISEEEPVKQTGTVEEVKKEEKPVIENPNIDLEVNVVEQKPTEEEGSEDIIDDLEGSGNKIDEDETLEHLQKLATERIKPMAKILNLSSFTVMKKPTASIKALENTEIKAAKWVLPNQKSIVLMKEFLGSELENMREAAENNTDLSMLYRKYRAIYDHIVSPKPSTYEAWLKSTPFSDADHYFFAAYIASFKGANYLPLDCENPKCAKPIMTDDMPIFDLVKFEDKESRKTFTDIYTSEANYAGKPIYVSEIVALNNKLAIGFKDASIYNLFEVYSLSQADREKYSSVLEFIPYIDSLYIIHEDTQQLEPIGYKIFPDNPTKTIKSKISRFYNALKTLTVDEFTPVKSLVRNITIDKNEIKMSYKYPAVKCPYCGTMTRETPSTAEQLLFVRYQLGALANTSLK